MTDAHQSGDSEARNHEFDDVFSGGVAAQEHLSIDDLGEVTLDISADIGRCDITIREILELKNGTVLPLDKVAGEMADVYVNGIVFARGEVVVLVDSLHVRLAEIVGAVEKDSGYA
jgi:flagellar motor switch protein FliN/FliY